jgi:hypothetical protein
MHIPVFSDNIKGMLPKMAGVFDLAEILGFAVYYSRFFFHSFCNRVLAESNS